MQPSTLSPEARAFFWMVLGAIVPLGALLYFTPGAASRHWAWEIASPRSAMLVGGIYVAATLYYLLLLRQREWISVQSSLAGLVLFSLWLLAAAARHWERFHPYRPLTLIWLMAYYLPPLCVPILAQLQRERFGPACAEEGERISMAWRAWLWLRGIVYLAVAVGVYVFAEALAPAWPWPIEAIDLRMFSGQVVAFGAYPAAAAGEGAWPRIRLAMVFTVLLAMVQLVGLALGPGPYRGRSPAGILLPALFAEWLLTASALLAAYRSGGAKKGGVP